MFGIHETNFLTASLSHATAVEKHSLMGELIEDLGNWKGSTYR